MKRTLEQYFTNQHREAISLHTKAKIYSRFLEKREHQYKKSRFAKLYKSLAYSFSLLAVVLAIFLWNPLGLFNQETNEKQQFVAAQTIGEITSSEGEYAIISSSNRPIAGNLIQPDDTVIVDEESLINILVHDAFTAQVYGPAQFQIVLNPSQESYSLKFINGWDNFDFDTLANTNKNIDIWTSDGLVIAKEEPSQSLSFSIKKDTVSQQRSIINNSDKEFEVHDTRSEEDHLTILAKHTVSIEKSEDGRIVILAQEEVSDSDTDTGEIILVEVDDVDNILTNDDISDIKRITKNDRELIQQALDKPFMVNEYNDLMYAYFLGNDDRYEIMINNINRRIDRLADIVDLPHQQSTNLTDLVNYAYLVTKSFEYYGIDPSIYHNLIVMMNNLDVLPHYGDYGILAAADDIKEITMDDIYKIFPIKDTINYSYR